MTKKQTNGILQKIFITLAVLWIAAISSGYIISQINDTKCFMKLENIEKDLKDIKKYFSVPDYGNIK